MAVGWPVGRPLYQPAAGRPTGRPLGQLRLAITLTIAITCVNSLDKFWTGCRSLENKLFTESVMLLCMALPSHGCAQQCPWRCIWMKGEYLENAAHICNYGNFECNYPVAMDGIQDLLFKMHFFSQ